nr:type III-A CRISPR-associated protein Csm2 [uncultured Prevotella sp.]
MAYYHNGYNPNGNGGQRQSNPEDYKIMDEYGKVLDFKPIWITNGADQSMVDYTRATGKKLAQGGLSSSKIRNIYGEIKRIQMGSYEAYKSSFLLLQPKVAYLVGRDPKNLGIRIFQDIFEKASKLVSNDKTYQNFCNLMEALVAYHKFFGGKD